MTKFCMRSSLNNRRLRFATILSLAIVVGCSAQNIAAAQDAATLGMVDQILLKLMAKHDIPGMAVAISHEGKDFFSNFGVLDRDTGQVVTQETLFEIGSLSKLLTITLAAYAEQEESISLDAPIGDYLSELVGSPLGDVPIYHLGTHTAGGFPLQLPDEVDSEAALFEYFRDWQPDYAMGTQRSYANPSIGLMGVLTARAENESFATMMEQDLFPAIGMNDTYVNVPDEAMGSYAWGHRDGEKVRVNPALLANEAYGVKTTSSDLLKFLKLNLNGANRSDRLVRAIRRTHIGYFDTGFFQQALVWEKYDYPLDPCMLKEGNSYEMILQTSPVVAMEPTANETEAYALSKTGSTNGFGAYVLALPSEDFAILMLANKNYPNGERVKTAYRLAADFLSFSTLYCE